MIKLSYSGYELESGKQFQFDQLKENENFVVLNSRWQQVLPTPSMIQHLPIWEEESRWRNTFIHASAFHEECQKVISSLFIELLLACLTAERVQEIMVWGGYGANASPHTGKRSVKPAPWATPQEYNAEVAYSAKLQ